MRDAGAVGRVTNISPVFWRDDWPVWGTPARAWTACRRVRPNRSPAISFIEPPSSDDFSSAARLAVSGSGITIPDEQALVAPGAAGLHAPEGDHQRRVLDRAQYASAERGRDRRSRGVAKVDLRGLGKVGDECGLGTFGKFSSQLVVTRSTAGSRKVEHARHRKHRCKGPRSDRRASPSTARFP
jgi:hypothetical protein